MSMSVDELNPLLQDWPGPFGLPPFEAVEAAHFEPAFKLAMAQHLAELEALAEQTAAPDFDNTLLAFDHSGRLLKRLELLFYNLAASATSLALQEVQRALAAPLAAHHSAVHRHAGLFGRIDALYVERQIAGLNPQQLRLLERLHLDFVRAGVRLPAEQQQRYAAVMQRLAALNTRFAQNVLADENDYVLELQGEAELAGLPDFVRAVALQAGRERGLADGVHAITLTRSHIVPFLSFSARRDLREQAWGAWVSRGEHAGPNDNRAIAREILALRGEQARLHGHACYADFALADTMAGSREAVGGLLGQVWQPALQAAAQERAALEALMASHGERFELQAWDWRFYAEKLRQARYQLDEAELKPYFALDAMVQALFDCAGRLFGLQFKHRADVPGYHPDVRIYEVLDGEGRVQGLFLHDNFARQGKRSGAWMNALRWQSLDRNGARVLPLIVNNNNFAKGAPGAATLLSFDDARTLFHEFGHGLHGLLSDVAFERLSGTQVLRDFVELPSQLFEHWLSEPEILKRHARHYLTDEPIPDALLAKLKAAELFGQGYETVRYTASALVDMAAHSRTEIEAPDITEFEATTLQAYGLPAAIGLNHRLAHFQHLFSSSGYASGYYVYLWAEVQEADAFEAFVEAGNPFDPAVAKRLQRCIYSSGNSREPGEAYREFRGCDAQVQPMLRGRGLLQS